MRVIEKQTILVGGVECERRLVRIPPKDLKPNTYNPASRLDKDSLYSLEQAIRLTGDQILEPVHAIVEAEGPATLIEGHRRHRLATTLGISLMYVWLYDCSGAERAKVEALFVDLNESKKSFTPAQKLAAMLLGSPEFPRYTRTRDFIKTNFSPPEVKTLIKKSIAPAVVTLSERVARTCGRADDVAFIKTVIWWMLNQRMQLLCSKLITGATHDSRAQGLKLNAPKMLAHAVECNKPLPPILAWSAEELKPWYAQATVTVREAA